MPAKSKAQQRLMGMAYAYRKGELKLSDIDDNETENKVKSLADSMTMKQLKKYAETKHDDLPDKISESEEGNRMSQTEERVHYLAQKIASGEIKASDLPQHLVGQIVGFARELSQREKSRFSYAHIRGDETAVVGDRFKYTLPISADTFENAVATLANTLGMGAVTAPQSGAGPETNGSGDVFTTQTPFCDPEKDDNCEIFRMGYDAEKLADYFSRNK